MIFGLLKRPALEEMLTLLTSCGIGLREGVSGASLFRPARRFEPEISRHTIEKGGFETLLTAMGDDRIDTAGTTSLGPASDDVWHFDSECICGHGDYAAIVENLCRLTRGDCTAWDRRPHRPSELVISQRHPATKAAFSLGC